MDENSQPLQQFEGMPDPSSIPQPEKKGLGSFFKRTFSGNSGSTTAAPEKKPELEIIYADDPIPATPTVPTAPTQPPPAPTVAPVREFKAIVPDPIFVRSHIKTAEQEFQENNIALETLGRNTSPVTSAMTTPPVVPPPPSGIAPVFANVDHTPPAAPAPNAAAAFRAATVMPTAPHPTPTPQQRFETTQRTPQNTEEIPSLRTYERDMADSIRAGQTVITINQAAQKRREERHELSEATEIVARNSLKTIMSVALIVAALGTFATIFLIGIEQKPVPPAPASRTIISVDTSRDAKPTAATRAALIAAAEEVLRDERVPTSPQSLTEISLIESGIANTGTSKKIPASTFLKTVATNIPATLTRALSDEWLFGFQSLNKTRPPFIIVGVRSFDNAYSGMLLWEKNMPTDLREIFLSHNTMEIGSGTSTQTVSIPLTSQFEDKIVKSRDTRVLKNKQDEIVLLYSFIDTKYLVITTNEETFREIITRYLATGLVR